MDHSITRRSLLAATALAGLATRAGLARAAGAADILKGSGKVVVSTWGGSYVDAQTKTFFKPFTDATGIEVVTTGTPDVAKLKLMEDSGAIEWDLLDAEGQMMLKAVKDGIVEKIDYDLIHKVVPADQLITETLNDYGFPSVAFGWVLTWNTTKYKDAAPKNWADFWDVAKFPGRRAVYANPTPLLEIALMADGVPIDKIYPLDIDRAFKKLDQLKPHVDVWFEGTGQIDVLLQNSEVDMMIGSHGRSYIAKHKGLPFDYTSEQATWEQSYWIVPKGAPNAANVMKLVAWMAQAQNEADFVKIYPYGVPNRKAYDLITPDLQSALPTSPTNLPRELKVDPQWWADHLDEVNRRWLEWYANR